MNDFTGDWTATKNNLYNYVDNLLLVLLSIWNVVKEDIRSKSSKMVFDISLTLPVNIFRSQNIQSSTTFVWNLKDRMSRISFTPTRISARQTYIPKDLHMCEYPFVRNDNIKKPFCPNYSRSYNVHKQVEKYFTVPKNNKHDMVATDWLKPVYVDQQQNLVQ